MTKPRVHDWGGGIRKAYLSLRFVDFSTMYTRKQVSISTFYKCMHVPDKWLHMWWRVSVKLLFKFTMIPPKVKLKVKPGFSEEPGYLNACEHTDWCLAKFEIWY